MKVQLLISRAGPAGAQNRGDVIEVDDQEGRRMIDRGQAKPVRGPKRERATVEPDTEQAVE